MCTCAQVAGALLIAVVIKIAGNVLKTFATSLALLVTCGWSMVLFDFVPTRLFGMGVMLTSMSMWLYARPDDAVALVAAARGLLCPKRAAAAGKDGNGNGHGAALLPAAAPTRTVHPA